MNIIEQIPINVQFACENLSCMINFKNKIKLVNQWGMELCSIKDEKETKEKPIQSFHSMNLKETKQDQEDLLNRYFEELPRYQLLMDDTVLPVSFKKIGQKKI